MPDTHPELPSPQLEAEEHEAALVDVVVVVAEVEVVVGAAVVVTGQGL